MEQMKMMLFGWLYSDLDELIDCCEIDEQQPMTKRVNENAVD